MFIKATCGLEEGQQVYVVKSSEGKRLYMGSKARCAEYVKHMKSIGKA